MQGLWVMSTAGTKEGDDSPVVGDAVDTALVDRGDGGRVGGASDRNAVRRGDEDKTAIQTSSVAEGGAGDVDHNSGRADDSVRTGIRGEGMSEQPITELQILRAELTAMTEQYITERTANAKAHQEIARLRDVCDAAKQVDATWSADEPYPPYMDCVDTDALVGLRTALAGTKEGA